jgi:outer membrane protein
MEESVLLSGATAYMDVSRDAANLEVQQNNVRVLQRTLKDTRNRFTAGQVTPTDVAQAEAQLAAGEATAYAVDADTRANYRRIIGVRRQSLARFAGRPAGADDLTRPSRSALPNPSVTTAPGVDVAQLREDRRRLL